MLLRFFAAYLTLVFCFLPAPRCLAGPVAAPYPVAGPSFTSACAAAALSGWTAAANTRLDTIELRDTTGALRRTLAKSEIQSLLPWMSFNTDADGPCALAFSDSGRSLFIGVCDTTPAPDGQPADAVLRYDTYADHLSTFLRIELGGFNLAPRPMMVHFKGRLYTAFGTTVTLYNARMNDTTAGTLVSSTSFGSSSNTTALAIDRLTSTLYIGNGTSLSRSPAGVAGLSLTSVGTVANSIRSMCWSDHYGGPSQGGLYIAHPLPASPNATSPLVSFVTPAMARATQPFSPTIYFRGDSPFSGLAATADGALLASITASITAGDAILIRDDTDTRLTYTQWKADEFAQVVRFAKGLISPDGEPAGWVIDADVAQGGTRFHPASPDAAAWVVLILLMSDHINADPEALPLVRKVLTRYAGLAPDRIEPSRSTDGIFRHWINPTNGGVKTGWDPEFATLSTMKIVAAAARADTYYAGDPEVHAAARAIICGVTNWDAYFDFSGHLYYKGLESGGRDNSSISSGWHEGVIFAEQAGVYGTTTGPLNAGGWLNRSFWPTNTLVTGRPVTGNGSYLPAFVSLYPLLLIDTYRQNTAWQTHILNLRLSNAAWTDDNGPKYNTVFSAGTTKSQWGGYNADSLSNHPGDVTTFTSLLAFCAQGSQNESDAAAAYQAYRNGARETFKSGATILYRRSQIDLNYNPDSAGLPDVALGALGLAELLSPGSVQAVLTGPYPSCAPEICPSDWNQDGGVDGADVRAFYVEWEAGNADINEDGATDGADVQTFFGFWEAGC